MRVGGGFEKVVDAVVGQERLAKLDVIIAGDDVSKKKPDPEIYNVAAQRLGRHPHGHAGVLAHAWFHGLTAADFLAKRVAPPWLPLLSGEMTRDDLRSPPWPPLLNGAPRAWWPLLPLVAPFFWWPLYLWWPLLPQARRRAMRSRSGRPRCSRMCPSS